VDFTREPIIETIISPREGYKLLVRNTKGEKAEEYYIDAVEVVSFGRAFFFRSLEKPKAFLVPTGDYEVLEVREARLAVKHVSHERSIKIGGGRENTRTSTKETPISEKEAAPVVEESPVLETAESTTEEVRTEKRRDRHRRRRRRHIDEQQERSRNREQDSEKEASEPKEKRIDEEKASAPMLIPPPPILISETLLSRYKDKDLGQALPDNQEEIITHEEILEQSVEPKVEEEKKEDKGLNSDGTALNRSLLDPPAFIENVNSDFLF
jgi:hypothetical protein